MKVSNEDPQGTRGLYPTNHGCGPIQRRPAARVTYMHHHPKLHEISLESHPSRSKARGREMTALQELHSHTCRYASMLRRPVRHWICWK